MAHKGRDRYLKISKDSVFYNALVLSSSGVALQILGFVYRIYLSRLAGAEGLGVYRLVLPVFTIVISATLTGVRLAVTRLSADMRTHSDGPAIRSLTRSCILIFLLLFAACAWPLVQYNHVISAHILGDERTGPALIIFMGVIFLAGFEGIFESLFLGIRKTKYTAISNLLEQGVQFAAVLGLLYCLRNGDHARTAALIVSGLVVSEIPVVIWLSLAYRHELCGRNACPRPRKVGRGLFTRILAIAFPVSCSSVFTNILSAASTVLLPQRLMCAGLSRQEAVSALGIVSGMAQPLITLPMVLATSLANVLLPHLSQSLSQGRREDVRRKIQKAFQATGLIILPATAIIVPLAPSLSRLLYGQDLSEVYVILLAISAILMDYQMICMSILNGLGLQKQGMFYIIIGEACQLAVTYFVAALPQVHIYGYLAGMVVSPLIVVVASLCLIRRRFGLWPRAVASGLVPIVAAVVVGLCTRIFHLSLLARNLGDFGAIILTLLGSVGLYLFLFPALGLHPLRYIRTLIPRHQKDFSVLADSQNP